MAMSSSRNKKLKGFTLIETVVTLAVTVMLVGFSTVKVNDLEQQVARDQSVIMFKRNFNEAMKRAILTKRMVRIDYFPKSRVVKFQCGRDYKHQYKLPKGVKMYGIEGCVYIRPDGTVSPRIIDFVSGDWRKTLRVQMLWGQLIET